MKVISYPFTQPVCCDMPRLKRLSYLSIKKFSQIMLFTVAIIFLLKSSYYADSFNGFKLPNYLNFSLLFLGAKEEI